MAKRPDEDPASLELFRPASHPGPGEYVIDPDRSAARFTVRKLALFPVHGRFTRVAGAVAVDTGSSDTSVVAVVPTAEIDTGNAQRDSHLAGAWFLDSDRHPFIRFRSTTVARTPTEGEWVVTGDLTVRGVTRRLKMAARAWQSIDDPERLRVTAGAEIRRSDFGVTALPWLAGDQIVVAVDVEVRRR